jgi:hypothetical protein
MTSIQLAAKLLMIESTCAEARANMLLKNEQLLIAGLIRIRKQIIEIQTDILSPDETHLYLAK